MNKTELPKTEVSLPANHPLVVATTKLPQDIAKQLLDGFGRMAQHVAEAEKEAAAIVVTDASQVSEMKRAGALRLKVKQSRCDAENLRKALKESYLRGGQAVDAVAGLIKDPCAKIEADLAAKEEFAERAEAARLHQRYNERVREISNLEIDARLYESQLQNFNPEQWSKFVQGLKDAQEADRKRAAEQAEADRKERERVAALEAENKRLAAEKAESERAARIAKFKADQAAAKAKAEAEAEAKRIRDEAQAKIDAAEKVAREVREAQERAERERKQREADAAAEAISKAKLAAEESAARHAELQRKSSIYYPLFRHMSDEHGLTLTESEMSEIVRICKGIGMESPK